MASAQEERRNPPELKDALLDALAYSPPSSRRSSQSSPALHQSTKMDFEKQLAAFKAFFQGKIVRRPLALTSRQLLTSLPQDFAGQAKADQLTRQILWTTAVRHSTGEEIGGGADTCVDRPSRSSWGSRCSLSKSPLGSSQWGS